MTGLPTVDEQHRHLVDIFGFISKPWQDFELKSSIAQALTYRRMQLENRLLADLVTKAGGAA